MKDFSIIKLKFPGVFLLFLLIIVLYVKESGSQSFMQKYKGIESEMSGDSAHWDDGIPCLTCHVLHMSPGAQLTAVDGNANLCMSCHNPGGGMASNTPFSNADIADPGLSGTSHAWNKAAINSIYGANLPTNSNMAGKVMNGEIVCSTCHQPHNQFYQPFLRTSNDQDAMCKNCHSVRDIGCYADDTTYKGSHPVGKVYPVADSRFNATPLDPNIILINTKVECSSCHGVHYATSGNANNGTGDGYLLRTSNDDNLCESCHTYTSHQGMGCTRCHQSHNPNRANIYMIRDTVETAVSGLKPVMFLGDTGINSFADGDGIYNGICEVCHTQTDHFRNDGSAPDQNHDNMGGQGGKDCLNCHTHNNQFNSAHTFPLSGTGCEECHGHDQGWEYSPGLYSQGRGSSHSHSTHTENDADDLKGPFIACAECHDTNEFPFFKSGTDSNGDGKYNLAETDVCNTCHSPGGSYDGVDDAVIGAKNNWDNGIYSANNILSGKEKWCATCHDDSPANSKADGSGVSAPNITGGESDSYIYGTGWGYFKTGHGLPGTESYPASGGITDGAGLYCNSCHDYSTSHIDHEARTFDDGDVGTTDPSFYRIGYRLILVGGQEPMNIPWKGIGPSTPPNTNNRYRLCAQCHVAAYPDSLAGPYVDPNNWETNLVTTGADGLKNRHEYHLAIPQARYPSDWSGANNSRMTCVACHNVHGSTYLAMVRDGKLLGREPGNQIWYNNDAIVNYNISNPNPPDPENLPLTASTGTLWIGNSSSNLCTHCHGNANTIPEYRTPFQNVIMAPYLEWVGDVNFVVDGVNPDTAVGGSNFTFRVKYFDANNDAPTTDQILVDIDGDGSDEAINMTGEVGDVNYTDGRIYSTTTSIARPVGGPGDVDYRFNFISTDSTAGGDPSVNNQFYVRNNPPILDWSGNQNFESDGVHPNTGPPGNFDFEILYTDTDGDDPASITLVIDDTQPGYDMIAGSGNVLTGKTFTKTLPLNVIGNHDYRFTATDNTVWGNSATIQTGPLSNNTVTVSNSSNNAPTLDYFSDSCFSNSVFPARGPFDGDYDFKIKYTDLDNDPPTIIKVIVDNTDEYILTSLYGNITTGRMYGTTIQISGISDHSYHFYAHDGQDAATGDPTIVNTDTVSVIGAAKVKKNDTRPGWYGSIQAAIDALTDTIIMVYPETYNENLIFNMNPADDKLTLEAVCDAENTIISASGNTVLIQNIFTYAKLNGFTITGGTIGFYVNNAKAVIENCIIRNNANRGINSGSNANSITLTNTIIRDNNEFGVNTNGNGAGIFLNNGTSHVFTNCTFDNNNASGVGGAIFAQNISAGNFIMTGTTISGNSAIGQGGGIYSNNCHSVITKSTITSNTSQNVGGGFFVQGGGYSINLTNSIVADNMATSGGGIYFNSGITVNFTNCTFSGNTTSNTVSGRGGAIYCNDVDPIITNCIFWNNIAGSNPSSGHNVYAMSNGALFTFTYCDLINNTNTLSGNGTYTVGVTNISSDPQFVDAANGDWSLQAGSPCIDYGTISGAPLDDIVGTLRGIDGRGDGNITGDLSDYDIGAYEYVP